MKPINPTLGAEPLRLSRISSIDVDAKSWDSVLFQQGKSLLDFDLNVQQRITKEQISQLSRMLVRSGFFTKKTLIANSELTPPSITIPDSKVNFNGSYARIAKYDSVSGAIDVKVNVADWSSRSATNAIFIWLELWFQEIVPTGTVETADGTSGSTFFKETNVYPFGNVDDTGSALLNEIGDPIFNAETTRRIQVRWRIRTDLGVNSSDNNYGFAKIANQTITTNTAIKAVGGRSINDIGAIAARNFLRGDQSNIPSGTTTNLNASFNAESDTNLWIAGNGTEADAILLNTVDGRVYGIPICFVYRLNNELYIQDIRDLVTFVTSPSSISSTGNATIGVSQPANLVITPGSNTNTVTMTTDGNGTYDNVGLQITTLGNSPITMDQIQQISNGSASSPSYSWANGTSTGLYLGTSPLSLKISVDNVNVATFAKTYAEINTTTNIKSKLGINAPSIDSIAQALRVVGGGASFQFVTPPTTVTLTLTNPAGGTNTGGNLTIMYKIVSIDQSGNRSIPSEPSTITNAAYPIAVTFTSVSTAASYEIYRKVVTGTIPSQFVLINYPTPITNALISGSTISITDSALESLSTVEPTRNSTSDMTVSGISTSQALAVTGGLYNNGKNFSGTFTVVNGSLSVNAGNYVYTATNVGSGYTTGDIVSLYQSSSANNARGVVTADTGGGISSIARIQGFEGTGYVANVACTATLVNQTQGRYLGTTTLAGTPPGNVSSKYAVGDFVGDPGGTFYIYDGSTWKTTSSPFRYFIPAVSFVPDASASPAISLSNGMYIYTFGATTQILYTSFWVPSDVSPRRPVKYTVWGSATPTITYAQNSSNSSSTATASISTAFTSGTTYLLPNQSIQLKLTGAAQNATFMGLYIEI